MSLQFIFGGSGSGKSTFIREKVIKESMEHPEKQYFIVVPDQFTMATQKAVVMSHPKKTIFNVDVQSFSRLCYRIFEEVGQKELCLIDDTGKNLILRKVAFDLGREGKIPFLFKNMEKIGCQHEVKGILSEFMQYGMTPADVEKMISYSDGKSALKEKLRDLKTIYSAFLEALSEKYVTGEERLSILAKNIEKSELLKGSVLYFDGFTGFTPVQRQVIAALLLSCEEVWVSLTIDAKDAKNMLGGEKIRDTELFHLTMKSYDTLCKLSKETRTARGEDVFLTTESPSRFQNAMSLSFLEKNLFRKEKEVFSGELSGLHVSQLPTPAEEMDYVGKMIRKLVKEKGYAYRDIAVVTGDLSKYQSAAKERLSFYEIPIFIDQGVGVSLNPFTEYLLSALDVLLTDFSYDSMMRFLRSGLTGLVRASIDQLAAYMKARNIRGKSRWSKAFALGFNGDAALMKEVNASREAVMRLLAPLLDIPVSKKEEKQENAEVLARSIYAFMDGSNLEAQLLQRAKYFEQQNDLQRAKEYEKIYAYMIEVLSQMVELLAEERMSLREFKDILEAGVSEMEIGMIPRTVDYVLIGDMERTRLNGVKVLFFVGMNDGVVPKNVKGTGLLSDMEREFFREGGFELSPSPREKMIDQRLYLYMNLCSPSERLYVSYSLADMDGSELRPSYLVDELTSLYGGNLLIEKPLRIPMVERLVSLGDAKEYFAGLLGEYASGALLAPGREEERSVLAGLYALLGAENQELIDGAFYTYRPTKLSEDLVKALYGMNLKVSVSRLEGYAACAYRHFLKYGLSLSPEEDIRFSAPDLGNFFHTILQRFGMYLEEKHIAWAGISREEAAPILHEIVEKEAPAYSEALLFQDATTAYQIHRMERILLRTVERVGYQLKKGKFDKMRFEITLKRAVTLEEFQDYSVTMTGTIDRLDTAEIDDKIYVRIVDYKSGDRKINVAQIYEGQQLQLAVYMDEALRCTAEDNPDKQVMPAGMFYYHVQDPYKDATESADYENWIREQTKLSGLISEQEEVYEVLDNRYENGAKGGSDVVYLDYKKDGTLTAASQVPKEQTFMEVINTAEEMCKQHITGILAGEKKIKPHDKESCKYCDYKEVCGYDSRLRGFMPVQ